MTAGNSCVMSYRMVKRRIMKLYWRIMWGLHWIQLLILTQRIQLMRNWYVEMWAIMDVFVCLFAKGVGPFSDIFTSIQTVLFIWTLPPLKSIHWNCWYWNSHYHKTECPEKAQRCQALLIWDVQAFTQFDQPLFWSNCHKVWKEVPTAFVLYPLYFCACALMTISISYSGFKALPHCMVCMLVKMWKKWTTPNQPLTSSLIWL